MSNLNNEYKIIYSLGVRCTAELALKILGFKKFSSLFGSLNIRNFKNIIECLDSDLDILINENNIISSSDIESMKDCQYNRTLHKLFDDITNWDSATFAHHDIIKNKNDMEHFLRGINRFNKIKNNNISTLFINVSQSREYDNTLETDDLVNCLIKNGWNNFHILFIYFNELDDHSINIICQDSYKTIFVINDNSVQNNEDRASCYIKHILENNYNLTNLLSIEEIDKLL